MEKKYVISIRFNSDTEVSGRCKVDCLSQEWIKTRIALFNQYTRKSLEGQSNQDFVAVLSCQESSMGLIREELKKYEPLNTNIVFTSRKNEVIESYIKEADKVYISALDSDDMYHPQFVQYLHDYHEQEGEQLLIFTEGYIYNAINGNADYYHYVAPPIYTQIFNRVEYLNCYRYYKMIRHFYMQRIKHTVITKPMYILILHNNNSFRYYRQEYPKLFGETYIVPEWKEIAEEFGINKK